MTQHKKSIAAISPLLVFICLYLLTSLIVQDFYKVPITVAFLVASVYAVWTTPGIPLEKKVGIYSRGAGSPNIMLMIWIFVLAGAFAASAQEMGAIDAAVNLSLQLLPDNLLLGGIFLAACFISMSIGTSVGTIVALTPLAAGIARETESSLPLLVAIVVGGGLFGFPGMLLGVPTFAVIYALVREWTNNRLQAKGIDGNGNPVHTSGQGEDHPKE